MVSQPTPDPLAARTGDPLYRLDYLTLTPTRAALVSRAIADLAAQLADDDLAILPHLQRCKTLLDAPSPVHVPPLKISPGKITSRAPSGSGTTPRNLNVISR